MVVPGLIAVGLTCFLAPLAVGRIGIWGDDLIQNFPLRLLVGHLIDSGHFPLWNAYLWSGTPLLAGFNAGAMYPLTLLFAGMPPELAWSAGEGITFCVGVLGLYYFLRALECKIGPAIMGSVTWTIGGAFGAQWVHIATVQAFAWVPWALYGIECMVKAESPLEIRRSSVILAFTGGMVLLSGNPEGAVYGIFPAAFYFLSVLPRSRNRRRLLAAGFLAIIVAGMIGAVQWVPGLAFIAHSQRARGSFTFFNSFAMLPSLSILMVAPYLLGGYGYGMTAASYFGSSNLPEVSSYVGLLPLMAFFATLPGWRKESSFRQARVWHVVVVWGLLLTWGGNTPLGMLMYHVPGYGLLRDQSRNLLEVDLGLAILAALWLNKISNHASHRGLAAIPLAVAGSIACAYIMEPKLVEQLIAGRAVPLHLAQSVAPAVWTTGVLALAAGVLLVLGHRMRNLSVWAAFVAVDLSIYAAGQYWTHPVPMRVLKAAVQPWRHWERPLHGNGRFAIYDPSLAHGGTLNHLGQPDLNLLSGAYSVQGYGSLVSQRYFSATGAHAQLAYKPRALSGRLANVLNLRFLLARPDDFAYRLGKGFRQPSHASVRLKPHQSRWMYLGRPLGIRTVWLAVQPTARRSRVRLQIIGPTNAVVASRQIIIHRDQRQTVLPQFGGNKAIALQLIDSSGTRLMIREVMLMTRQRIWYCLNGPLTPFVRYPQWRYRSELNGQAVFYNKNAKGWGWLKPLAGSPSSRVNQFFYPPQESPAIQVHAQASLRLVVSQTYSPGWKAYIRRPSRSVLVVPAKPYGVVQSYQLPPGHDLIRLVYQPPLFFEGLAVTVAGLVISLGAIGIGQRPTEYTFAEPFDPTR